MRKIISCSLGNSRPKDNVNHEPSTWVKLRWTLGLILMHLLPERNRWHFKNNLCFQFTVEIKPHHHFQRWQWDSSAWVFLGWQTPALIRAWMMSSIHYTMIKSLPPPLSPSHITVMNQTFIKVLSRLFWQEGEHWETEDVEEHLCYAAKQLPENEAWWVKTQWPVRPAVTHTGTDAEKPKWDLNKASVLLLQISQLQIRGCCEYFKT